MNDDRFEIKYVVAIHRLNLVKLWIEQSPFDFFEPYPNRKINNIYFDSYDLNDASDNLSGISDRRKLRLRWYNSNESQDPFLEYKIKRNRLGSKQQFQLSPLKLDGLTLHSLVRNIKSRLNLPLELRYDERLNNPTLFNSYHREYFVSRDARLRITLDSNLRFHALKRNTIVSNSPVRDTYSNVVIEFKCDLNHKKALLKAVNNFPFLSQRFSKYLVGLARDYDFTYF
jgi:SPX domain protein involved in polyphosphate accumulation